MMHQNPPGFSTHTLTLRQGIEIANTDEGSGPVSLLLAPAGRLALLPRCGHMFQWECSEAVAAQIRQFVLG
jgi:pimeloyl-ACP methyl ester carboxylesterase